MQTLIVFFSFAICVLSTSPPKCQILTCPADCGVDIGNDGCSRCSCLEGGITSTPSSSDKEIKCSTPKCPADCGIAVGNEGCPTCSCLQGSLSPGGKAAKCSPPKCPEHCGITVSGGGCPRCACPRRNGTIAKENKCPVFKCPGECSVGVDSANGCQTCQCAAGVKTENGLDKQLGDACLSTADCAAAYSTCKNNKCTCLDSFTTDDGVCKAPSLQCPTWKGQSKSTPGKACEHHYNQTTAEEVHTCDKTKEFCFVHPKERSENGPSLGHCCPKPPKSADSVALVCPYSISNNGTCPDLSTYPADAPIPLDKQRTCSYITSECVHQFKQTVCCPLPCTGSSSHFSVNGKCFDYVQIGNVCDNDAQCIGGSHCLHQGSGKPLCRCPKKTCYEPSQHCCDL